jgi:hypothetical protein
MRMIAIVLLAAGVLAIAGAGLLLTQKKQAPPGQNGRMLGSARLRRIAASLDGVPRSGASGPGLGRSARLTSGTACMARY